MTDHSQKILDAIAAGDREAFDAAMYNALRDEEYIAKMREAYAQDE